MIAKDNDGQPFPPIQARHPAVGLHRQYGRWPVYSGAIVAYYKDFAMKRLISSFAALVAVACLVSACGQKGPLYLPDGSKHPEGQAQQTDSHKHSM